MAPGFHLHGGKLLSKIIIPVPKLNLLVRRLCSIIIIGFENAWRMALSMPG